jgi:hypothetical protein
LAARRTGPKVAFELFECEIASSFRILQDLCQRDFIVQRAPTPGLCPVLSRLGWFVAS